MNRGDFGPILLDSGMIWSDSGMTWVDLLRLWVVCVSLDLGVGAIISELLF